MGARCTLIFLKKVEYLREIHYSVIPAFNALGVLAHHRLFAGMDSAKLAS